MKKVFFLITLLFFTSQLSAFEAEFFPKKRARNASEIRIKFAKPIAPLGDPTFRFNPIEKISCISKEIKGVWEDPALYIVKFDQPLKAGILCRVKLKDDIKSVSGETYSGPKWFEFDSDVVTVQRIIPNTYQKIRNEEIFIFSFTGDVDIVKNKDRIFFRRMHTREIVESSIVDHADVTRLVENLFPYLKNEKFFGVRPKVKFADNENVMLVFRNIVSEGGVVSDLEEKYAYTVME
ncbi:MAG: hypothetical protein N3B13_10415, partial [Deltaproteobacteria bacterium]|nr:hypothetical protein [Deltaproteobacteria bacterium]